MFWQVGSRRWVEAFRVCGVRLIGAVVGVLVVAGFGFRRGEGGEGFGKWDAWEGGGGEDVAFEWM